MKKLAQILIMIVVSSNLTACGTVPSDEVGIDYDAQAQEAANDANPKVVDGRTPYDPNGIGGYKPYPYFKVKFTN